MTDFTFEPMIEPLVRALREIADHSAADQDSHCPICYLAAELALAGDWPYHVPHEEPTT